MANHSHENVCQTFLISEEFHLQAANPVKSEQVAKGYYYHEKYLCDVRMVTGKDKDDKKDKILKGQSVANYPTKAAPGDVKTWQK